MKIRRVAALCLAIFLFVSLLPAAHANTGAETTEELWARIYAFEDTELAKKSTRAGTEPAAEDYAALSEAVERLVLTSGNCRPGSIIRHGSFFYWTARDGEVCGYSPGLRARIHAAGVDREADPAVLSGVTTTGCVVRGGSAGSADVAVFQPYKGLDDSFGNQYPDEGTAIAETLGGTSTLYTVNEATVDQIAAALEDCAVVIVDSHGDTDYYNWTADYEDRVTKANTSYLCLNTNAGWTEADQKPARGPYGTYYHVYNGGSSGGSQYYCVDGTALANHMGQRGCGSFFWMAICYGMATDGLCEPLRENGVELVLGYSQAVTFGGDLQYAESFWEHVKDGHTAGEAFAYMKEQNDCDWDPLYRVYGSLSKARYKCAAFPNLVSSEDEHQGHRTVNPASADDETAGYNNDPRYGACNVQTARSEWTLYPQQAIDATVNHADWGAVSVRGNTVFAAPSVGFYTEGYELLSGSAEVSRYGDCFALIAAGPCSVRINFAPKTSATVRFVTPDGVSCDEIATYVGDEILLPAPDGTPIADAREFSFLGWTDQPVPDASEKPVYLEPGSAWTADAEDTVFYALYTYTVRDEDAEDCFLKLDKEPADWDGEYVLTYNGQVVLDASGTYTGVNLGSKSAAIGLASTGMRLEGDSLYDVPDEYVYLISESEKYDECYTFRMKGSNNYIAYLSYDDKMTTTTNPTDIFSLWNLGWSRGSVSIQNTVSSSRRLQYNTTAKVFNCYESTQKSLTLFRRRVDPVFYTTAPDEIPAPDYTVSFSVLGDKSVIAPMTCNTQTDITLPVAEAPAGYRFLGWVERDCDNVDMLPETVLTGAYTASHNVTLLALFTYNDYGGDPPALELMTAEDTFSDGDKIVIVESGGVHGLYQKAHNYAYVSNFAFTEDAEAILADELRYFNVTEVDGGWYLGDETNGWLYTPDNQTNLTIRYNTAFMTAFTLTTLDGHLALQHTVSYNDNVFYVNCGTNLTGALTNKWRMVNANNMTGVSTLDIYRLHEGGPAVVRYTTVLPHEHTPGEAVEENRVEPTCTEKGGYDTVVYCTGCKAELSREHTELQATGHTPGTAVEENRMEPTCTEKGGYDNVVYCTVCKAELSREHTELDPLGHDWDAPSYEWSEDNSTVTATRICKSDETHGETETVAATSEVTKEATVDEEGEITYTAEFTNPAFEKQTKAVAIPKLKPANPFDDVVEGKFYYDAVLWAVAHEPQITNGTDATHFSPDATCTRGQVVTFLWRAKGCPEPASLLEGRGVRWTPNERSEAEGNTSLSEGRGVRWTPSERSEAEGVNPFIDVKEGSFYYKAVLWAVENGITNGTSATTFGPNDGCTRGQVVTFLWRTEGKPEPTTENNPFTDVTGGFYYKAVLWAVENKITAGMDATHFAPMNTCTRGQIVTFLYRDLAE